MYCTFHFYVLAPPFATKNPKTLKTAQRFYRELGVAAKRRRYIVLHTTEAISNTIGCRQAVSHKPNLSSTHILVLSSGLHLGLYCWSKKWMLALL